MADDELDLDGDGVPDVRVPGLPGRVGPDDVVGEVGVDATAAQVSAVLPPSSSHYSPMGQIEHFGYALRSETARQGWRGRVVRTYAKFYVAAVVLALVVAIVAAAAR